MPENFDSKKPIKSLLASQDSWAFKTDDEDDDQNFIRKDQPQEINEKSSETKLLEEDLKFSNLIAVKNNQQRNLDRETGGLEVEKPKEISSEDVWDDRSEQVDKMGSTDVFNTSGMRSVVWRKKHERIEKIKNAMEAAAVIGKKLKGKVSAAPNQENGVNQGYVDRLKNLRLDRSSTNNNDDDMGGR